MPEGPGKKTFIVLVHLVSLLVLIRLVAVAYNDIILKKKTLQNLSLAIKIIPDDAGNYYDLGLVRQYDLFNRDLNRAIEFYGTALRKNPLFSRALIGLANAYQAAGRKRDAFLAVDSYRKLTPNNTDSLWRVAVFYLVNSDRVDKAMEYFEKLIEMDPGLQTRVYDVCYQMKLSNKYIMNHLLKDKAGLYPSYLGYLISHGKLDDAMEFYNNVSHKLIYEKSGMKLCNFLIKNKRYDDAFSVWEEMIGKLRNRYYSEGSLLSNGGFESDITNGCFGWVVGKARGVKIYEDHSLHLEGRRSLGISFSGEYNVDLDVIRQLVLLAPENSYLLKAYVKTDGLTTTNGLFFEARGYDCNKIYARSDVITGTNSWGSPVSLRFSVPPDCGVVKISLRRQKSRKFNNKIKGNAWVDGLQLIRLKTGP